MIVVCPNDWMNLLIKTQYVSDEVRMWVFEEVLPNGEKLTDVINKTNVRNMDDAVLYLFIIAILDWFM